MTDTVEPRLVSIKDATKILGRSRQTIYRLEQRGVIRLNRKLGRTMVPMSEIDRLVEVNPKGTQEAVDEPVGEPEKLRPKKVQLFPKVS